MSIPQRTAGLGDAVAGPDSQAPGISVVIPVRNGARWLDDVLAAICRERWRGPLEIIAIDDGSTDDSRAILERHRRSGGVRVLDGRGQGAAAAINLGVHAASHPFIAQLDQDVVIQPGWLDRLVAVFDDPTVAAAQGCYIIVSPDAGPWSRVMALDLGQRYRKLGRWTNHVCTGNSVYRRTALREVGLFDEQLGYGYDNDVSYRLTRLGYRLAYCADARSVHHWREGLAGYARQQFGFGYGRLDLIRKHRRRLAGDDVSRLGMMMHGPVMGAGLVAGAVAGTLAALGSAATVPAWTAAALLAALMTERLAAGLRASGAFGNPAGFWFVPVHAVRDVAWAFAIATWVFRRSRRAPARPFDSMRPRGPGEAVQSTCAS